MLCSLDIKPPWRNGLACWTSNSKVVGSSPTGGGIFFFLFTSWYDVSHALGFRVWGRNSIKNHSLVTQ